MSTTAVVTPYESETERARNELAVREERALAEFRQQRRASRVQGHCAALPPQSVRPLSNNQVTLGTGSVEFVQKAAESLGYSAYPVAKGHVELVRQGRGTIVLSQNRVGQVVLAGEQRNALQEVTREYTAQRVVAHLASRNLVVQGVRTTDGEIVITGADQAGPTRVSVDVRPDGVAVVDVEGIKGPGCQTIISSLAFELGGNQIDTARKAEFFQPTFAQGRTRV